MFHVCCVQTSQYMTVQQTDRLTNEGCETQVRQHKNCATTVQGFKQIQPLSNDIAKESLTIPSKSNYFSLISF